MNLRFCCLIHENYDSKYVHSECNKVQQESNECVTGCYIVCERTTVNVTFTSAVFKILRNKFTEAVISHV